jgi:hypothetical protein
LFWGGFSGDGFSDCALLVSYFFDSIIEIINTNWQEKLKYKIELMVSVYNCASHLKYNQSFSKSLIWQ